MRVTALFSSFPNIDPSSSFHRSSFITQTSRNPRALHGDSEAAPFTWIVKCSLSILSMIISHTLPPRDWHRWSPLNVKRWWLFHTDTKTILTFVHAFAALNSLIIWQSKRNVRTKFRRYVQLNGKIIESI